MIVDSNGRLFEDRRKRKRDRRESEIDTTGGRRIEDRRKANNKIKVKPEHLDKKSIKKAIKATDKKPVKKLKKREIKNKYLKNK